MSDGKVQAVKLEVDRLLEANRNKAYPLPRVAGKYCASKEEEQEMENVH